VVQVHIIFNKQLQISKRNGLPAWELGMGLKLLTIKSKLVTKYYTSIYISDYLNDAVSTIHQCHWCRHCGTSLQRYVRTVLYCYIAVTSLGSSTEYFALH
jgi:hypothetical protein